MSFRDDFFKLTQTDFVFQDFFISEPNDLDPAQLDFFLSFGIFFLLTWVIMVISVYFDTDLGVFNKEVHEAKGAESLEASLKDKRDFQLT